MSNQRHARDTSRDLSPSETFPSVGQRRTSGNVSERDPCAGCSALIQREGYAPWCDRATHYGQPCCLRLSGRPPREHDGAPHLAAVPPRRRGRR